MIMEVNGTAIPIELEQNSSTAALKELLRQGIITIPMKDYAPNTWNFTRLGKVINLTENELKKVLGKGNITATLRLREK